MSSKLHTVVGAVAIAGAVLAAGFPSPAHAGNGKRDDHININPLVTLSEQLEEITQECINRPLDRDCEQRKQEVKDDIKKLRALCRKSPENAKCEALATPRRDVVSTIEFFCRQHPHEPRCVRRKEFSKRRMKRVAKYCAHNPDAKRCQGNADQKKEEVPIDEYCKVFPEKRKCVRYLERLERNKTPVESDINSF